MVIRHWASPSVCTANVNFAVSMLVNFAISMLDIQFKFVQQMSTFLFRYWTFNMILCSKCQLCYFDTWTFNTSLYNKCQLCYFDIGHSIWVCTANVNFASSILDIQYEFVQLMSTLLFRYWTFNMGLLSKCQLCYFDIGQFSMILYSKCQLCYFDIGHSIWVCLSKCQLCYFVIGHLIWVC